MIIKENINLKDFSNMKVGGIARKLVYIEDKQELVKILKEEEKTFLIGNGTNVLFDDGYHNICLISLKKLNKISIISKDDKEVKVNVQAGLDLTDFIKYMEENNFAGIENMTGIPGSIGGIVNMNGGAFGTEIFDVVDSVEIIDNNFNIITLKKDELKHNYRTTEIKQNNWIIISTTLKLGYGFDKESSQDKINKRNSNHPITLPNLGSTFKNPKGEYAAQIISDLGLKGYRIGGACISEKHPNFITNIDNASFNDIMNIIDYVKSIVKKERNIELETEIIILKKA